MLLATARETEVQIPVQLSSGRWTERTRFAYADDQGIYGMGQAPVLTKHGASVRRIDVETLDDLRDLGADAAVQRRSVTLDIDNTDGGYHTVRLIKIEGDMATVADPGPGIAKDIRFLDLFQQAYAGTVAEW